MTFDELRALRTEAVEDFLKTVYQLQQQIDPVPTTLIASALNIQAPSVTEMIKRLSKIRTKSGTEVSLLDYMPYRGVRLSADGEKIALEVVRHHRLIELYLSEALGYSWDEVHDEAERLEHVISEQFESRIAAALGHPNTDPHGDPIPALDGTIPDLRVRLLSELNADDTVQISRIADQSPEVLRYLSELGLTPGTRIMVVARSPLNDTITFRSSEADTDPRTISMQVARQVLVTS